MTPTAIELWNDKKFINKRCNEQFDYMQELTKRRSSGSISSKRYTELHNSAVDVLGVFEMRYYQLI